MVSIERIWRRVRRQHHNRFRVFHDDTSSSSSRHLSQAVEQLSVKYPPLFKEGDVLSVLNKFSVTSTHITKLCTSLSYHLQTVQKEECISLNEAYSSYQKEKGAFFLSSRFRNILNSLMTYSDLVYDHKGQVLEECIACHESLTQLLSETANVNFDLEKKLTRVKTVRAVLAALIAIPALVGTAVLKIDVPLELLIALWYGLPKKLKLRKDIVSTILVSTRTTLRMVKHLLVHLKELRSREILIVEICNVAVAKMCHVSLTLDSILDKQMELESLIPHLQSATVECQGFVKLCNDVTFGKVSAFFTE